MGVNLKTCKTISTHILKNIKSELLLNVTPEAVKIDPELAFNWMIVKILEDIDFQAFDLENIQLIAKFCFDGGETQQEIVFQNVNDIDDKYFFLVSFVPLIIKYETKTIWINPNQNSVDWCKPLEILFVKENDTMFNETYSKFKKYEDYRSPKYQF